MWIISKVLYPLEFCQDVNLSQYSWFTYVLEDAACTLFPHPLAHIQLTNIPRLPLPPCHIVLLRPQQPLRTANLQCSITEAHFNSISTRERAPLVQRCLFRQGHRRRDYPRYLSAHAPQPIPRPHSLRGLVSNDSATRRSSEVCARE